MNLIIKSIFLILLSFQSLNSFSNPKDITNILFLKQLCRTWGYMKYYHPNVSCGKADWDSILIVALIKIDTCQSKNCFNKTVDFLFDAAGSYKISKGKKLGYESKDVRLRPNFNWMTDSVFYTAGNSDKLKSITSNINRGYYYSKVKFTSNGRGIEHINEKTHNTTNYPDEKIRLLSLFRFWNLIEYDYPYKKEDWDYWLEYFIPVFINAKNETEYHLAVMALSSKIKDSHCLPFSAVLGKYYNSYVPPFILFTLNDKTIIKSIFELRDTIKYELPVKVGDIVLEINDKEIGQLKNELLEYIGDANDNQNNRMIDAFVITGLTDSFSLKVFRDERDTLTFNLKRFIPALIKYAEIDKTPVKKIEEDILYINMSSINNDYLNKNYRNIQKYKGIIIDLRYYPEKLTNALSILKKLYSQKTIFAKVHYNDVFNKGTFYSPKQNWEITKFSKSKQYLYTGKVIVLVNENTASAAEKITMQFQQAKNVTVIGSQSAGALGGTRKINLPGNISTYYTHYPVFYPDDTPIYPNGVKIDVVINHTIKSIEEGKDIFLEEAIKLIRNK